MKLVLVFLISFFQTGAFAVTVKDIQFSKTKNSGRVSVKFDGNLRNTPELSIHGNTIQVKIPNSKVKKEINQKVSFATTDKDTKLKAYQTTKNTTKIKASFPFNMKKREGNVFITLKEDSIELSFPRVRVKTPAKKKKVVKKEYLDEKYLNSLLDVKEEKKVAKKVVPVPAKKKVAKEVKEDKVQTVLAATKKPVKQDFSLINYGGKFVAFLGMVLLLFFGVVNLMKKGVIKKGRLGFLNNADLISVVGQTHIAPKKSLMLIKAHKQVFLVSNTEAGIQPISEIKDAAGLFKDGEKAISGINFDTTVSDASEDDALEARIKIKEDITQSNKVSSLTSYETVKDKVKFSDQLKTKVKKLKQLQ